MKLCQFKSENTAQQRLGVLVGDAVVCDVAELARAVKNAGGAPADWLLQVNSTLTAIQHGPSGVKEIAALLDGAPSGTTRGQTVAYSLDSIEFLPAVNPGKILA